MRRWLVFYILLLVGCSTAPEQYKPALLQPIKFEEGAIKNFSLSNIDRAKDWHVIDNGARRPSAYQNCELTCDPQDLTAICREEPEWFHSCVHTCNDYQLAVNDGWRPMDELDLKLESAFIKACGALKFLSSFHPVRDHPYTVEQVLDPNYLPASLVVDMLTDNSDSSCQPDMTLAACEKISKALTIKEEEGGYIASAYDLVRSLEPVAVSGSHILIWQTTTNKKGKYLGSGYKRIGKKG